MHHHNPPSFVCPLALKIMENPVMDTCAHTFERDAIVEWVNQHSCCPISRKPLAVDDLVPNHTLVDRIEKWKWQNGSSRNKKPHLPRLLKGHFNRPRMKKTQQSSLPNDEATGSSGNTEPNELDGIERLSGDIEMGTTTTTSSPGSIKTMFRNYNNSYRALNHSLVLLPQERRTMEMAQNRAKHERAMEAKQHCWRMVQLGTGVAILTACLTVAIVWFMQTTRQGK